MKSTNNAQPEDQLIITDNTNDDVIRKVDYSAYFEKAQSSICMLEDGDGGGDGDGDSSDGDGGI